MANVNVRSCVKRTLLCYEVVYQLVYVGVLIRSHADLNAVNEVSQCIHLIHSIGNLLSHHLLWTLMLSIKKPCSHTSEFHFFGISDTK